MNRTPLKSKHSRELSAANKLFLLLSLLPLWSVSEAAVQVKSIAADYANKKVTFSVSWAAGSRGTYSGKIYNSKVWVFVDYTTVTNPNTTGAWQRTTVASATATAGTVSGNTGRGFYLQGTDGAFSSTVTVTLSGVPAKFNWCATATDYPPNAVMSNGTYTLKGTAPFTINGNTSVSARTYTGACITTITDATGCPGTVTNPAFTAGAITSGSATVIRNIAPNITIGNTTIAGGGDGRISYQWRRSGTSSATLTGSANTYSIASLAANYSTAGTYYFTRWAKDNTCNTGWKQSSNSYTLVVLNCPYTGSDLYIDATHICQQRTGGAQNWEAWIKDSRDNKLYRIAQLPTGLWTMDDYLNYKGHPAVVAEKCGAADPNTTEYWRYIVYDNPATPLCPAGWQLPTQSEFELTVNSWVQYLSKVYVNTGETVSTSSQWCQTGYIAFLTSACLQLSSYGNRTTSINPVTYPYGQKGCGSYIGTYGAGYRYSGYARCVRAL